MKNFVGRLFGAMAVTGVGCTPMGARWPIAAGASHMLALALIGMAGCGGGPRSNSLSGQESALSVADNGYHFTRVAKLGDSAPGGGKFIGDFEVTGLNRRGEMTFVTEVDLPDSSEGVFRFRNGAFTALARPLQAAPGGGNFGCLSSSIALAFGATNNDHGDVAFAYAGCNFDWQYGGGRVFRYSHKTNAVTQIVVPDSTPAPGGGLFRGMYLKSDINNERTIAFAGLVDTKSGRPGFKVGLGIYTANSHDVIAKVAGPGDAAPGSGAACDPGGVFDVGWNPGINDRGDVGFGGHVKGEECVDESPNLCDESIYVRWASTGKIQSLAHQGCPAPGTKGKTYRIAFGTALNAKGDLAFVGDLTKPPEVGDELTVFSRIGGVTAPVVLRGDPMPGGGHFAQTLFSSIPSHGITERGDVYFIGVLDTVDKSGIPDSGLYVKREGKLHVIARTGDVLPGIGTIAGVGSFGARMNRHSQVVVAADLTDGTTVMLLGTPVGDDGEANDKDDDE